MPRPVFDKPIQSIKFIAEVPVIHTDGTVEWIVSPTCFKLGQGPCGERVTALKCSTGTVHLAITQWTQEGGHKVFLYKHSDIVGRVEVNRTPPAGN